MKKYMFLLVAALGLVATSCSNEEDVIVPSKKFVTEISLALGGDATRMAVTHDAEGLKFAWEDGEIVYVFPAEADNHDYATFEYNPSTQKFSHTAGAGTLAEGLTVGKKYYVAFGSLQAAEMFNDGKVAAAMELSAGMAYLYRLPMVSDIFTATEAGTFATLHHTCGVVEIPLTGSGSIYDIQFNAYSSTAGKQPAGTMEVTFNTDTDGKIKEVATTGESKWVYATDYKGSSSRLTLSATAKSVLIPVMPGEYNNVVISYMCDAYTYSQAVDAGEVTVVRGKIHKKATPINIIVE